MLEFSTSGDSLHEHTFFLWDFLERFCPPWEPCKYTYPSDCVHWHRGLTIITFTTKYPLARIVKRIDAFELTHCIFVHVITFSSLPDAPLDLVSSLFARTTSQQEEGRVQDLRGPFQSLRCLWYEHRTCSCLADSRQQCRRKHL